jgi:hypothetical protein
MFVGLEEKWVGAPSQTKTTVTTLCVPRRSFVKKHEVKLPES